MNGEAWRQAVKFRFHYELNDTFTKNINKQTKNKQLKLIKTCYVGNICGCFSHYESIFKIDKCLYLNSVGITRLYTN